nr:deubiquitinase MYSM1 [Anolis sagrei ordinatus]
MEAVEELDIDVEGDVAAAAQMGNYDDPSSSVLQDHYLDSTWRTDMGLPWSLDNTISEENKAAIEKMLLEEEYYLSSKSLPEKLWQELKESDKKCTKSPHKKEAKLTLRSPPKSATGSLKWTTEEKELFEQGLTKFGRRWTKISMMIGSRNVLQVKSYARQYFKNKAKTDGPEKVEQRGPYVSIPVPSSNEDDEGKTVAWAATLLRGRADPNLNAVKIEKLSDDEEVDITDEMDELLSHIPQQESGKCELFDTPKSPSTQSNWTVSALDSEEHTPTALLLTAKCSPKAEESPETPETVVLSSENNSHDPLKPENEGGDEVRTPDWFSCPELCGEQRNYDDPSSSVLQDHYLDSTWRTDMGLPWSLDNTISEENKAAIEKMLLEEEYYLSSKSLPEKLWQELKESDKKCTKSPHKKEAKLTLRSPPKSATGSLKWTTEEKELFEQGLTKFGRRWTKISMMIGSRNVLQVKSYARQYFKNKAKTDGPEKVEQRGPYVSIPVPSSNEDDEGKTVAWAATLLRGRADPNLNAVKIEKLSDDEEVDITDEMDELLSHIPQQESGKCELFDTPKSPSTQSNWTVSALDSEEHTPTALLLTAKCSPKAEESPETPETVVLSSENNSHDPLKPENEGGDEVRTPDWFSCPELCGEQRDFSENNILVHPSEHLEEDGHMNAEELKPPDQEVEIDRNVISEEEKQAIPEFFVGRQAKTPERYLKIRNYILDQWERSKPKYLNKTSVRPGLKNCGDVNCIGRIHTYLELIGAINFGCEQAVYNRPQTTDKMRPREGKDAIDAYQLVQRLQSMRTRRRRVRDPWGNWCDAKDLEGQTFEHLSAEELAKRREDEKFKVPKATKGQRHTKSSFDPFQLIPCCSFTEEKPEPFQVRVTAEALLIPMDKIFHRDSDLTCLQKLLECMRKTLDSVANSFIAEEFLAQLENLFLSTYKNEEWNDAAEENTTCPNDLPI